MNGKGKKSKGLLSLTGVLLIIIFFIGSMTNCVKKSDSGEKNSNRTKNDQLILEGVTVSGVNLGHMTKAEAKEILTRKTASMGFPIFEFRFENRRFSISAEEIELMPEIEKTVNKAYAVGKTENNATKRKTISKKKGFSIEIPLSYSFNEDKFLLIANDYLADVISDPSPMNVEIGENYLLVTNPIFGKAVNTETVKMDIEKELLDFVSDNPINISLKKVKKNHLTFDEFRSLYLRSPKDANYTVKNGKPIIEPEIIGIDFDENEAKRILKDNRNSTVSYKIPAVITYPEVTAKYLEEKYVNVVLSTYSTSFAGSSPGRIENIKLAAKKINGYVLNPGEKFSYNQVVGPRTEAAGFKMAQVYVGNQVVDGIGGGICQVSSALYNAVVMADLKTVSRTNHSIPVSYVPKGRDATVAYGTIDYIFQNNKSYPVSIRATVFQNMLTVSIIGTEEMDYSVEFEAYQTSVVPFSTIKENDSNLFEGEEKTLVRGINGAIYDSYRVYKKNGVEYNRKHESKSRYLPTSQKIAVGIKKVTKAVSGNKIKYRSEKSDVSDDSSEKKKTQDFKTSQEATEPEQGE